MEITIEYQPILEAPAASGVKLARRSLGEGRSIKNNQFCKTNPIYRMPKMNLTIGCIRDYENKWNWTPGENKPNSPNTENPMILSNFCAILHDFAELLRVFHTLLAYLLDQTCEKSSFNYLPFLVKSRAVSTGNQPLERLYESSKQNP
ncbi:MAG: hypothetical protein ACYSSL_04975 [Planctomycetota bacterium]|jgi:hypothetical protein